jgi:hypothetical protein
MAKKMHSRPKTLAEQVRIMEERVEALERALDRQQLIHDIANEITIKLGKDILEAQKGKHI